MKYLPDNRITPDMMTAHKEGGPMPLTEGNILEIFQKAKELERTYLDNLINEFIQ